MTKKEFFKNPNKYNISIIEVNEKNELSKNNSIKTLNCKALEELGNDINIFSNGNELVCKFGSSEYENKNESDFETAIKATEYGKFNWLILFAAFWGYMSCMYVTTSISLVLPSAECDLNLSNFDKGMLNAVVYIGMIISAFFWGLVSDIRGRRNVLIVSFALDAFFTILVGLAQNFSLLLVAKLFSGFISSAPIAVLSSYLAENHANTYRSTVILCTGFFSSSASITLPLLAWLIIPSQIRLVFFNGYIILPSWRIFLLVSSLPSVIALITLCFLDESPKFLMFQGKNDEALEVFKRIYLMNTGKSKDTFPVNCLKNEAGNDQIGMKMGKMSAKQVIINGWKQIIPIFQRPHFPLAFIPWVTQFCTLFSVNTVRLWSPQLFASAIEKEKYFSNDSITTSTICDLLIYITNPEITGNQQEIKQCGGHIVADKVYFNAMITGVVTGIGYLISSYIVKSLEKKWLMIISYSLSVTCCLGLYLSTTSNYLLGVISIYIAVTSTSATAVIGVVIDIFPTSLRTTAVALCLTFGRLGAMVGNMVFPLLLDWNCIAPFIILAVLLIFAAGLTLFLPKTKGKHLE